MAVSRLRDDRQSELFSCIVPASTHIAYRESGVSTEFLFGSPISITGRARHPHPSHPLPLLKFGRCVLTLKLPNFVEPIV